MSRRWPWQVLKRPWSAPQPWTKGQAQKKIESDLFDRGAMQFGQILTVSVADCFGADAHGMRQADHKRALSPACSWRLIFEGLQSFAVLPFTDLAPCDAAHVPSHPVSTCEACVRACVRACMRARLHAQTHLPAS